jgi:hypothetical protein
MQKLAAATVLVANGCVPIDGGAVEVRWTIQTLSAAPRLDLDEGDRMTCDEAAIETVTLRIDSGDAAGSSVRFACDDHLGSSDFDVAPGQHLFTLEAGGPRGEEAVFPDPIAAEVREGEVTDLQVVLIRMP